MKKIMTILIFMSLLFTNLIQAQEIEVRYESDDNGELKFIASNSTRRPYFVVMEFSNLTGSMSITPGEAVRIEQGEKQLCTIKGVQGTQLFSSYRYKYYTSDPTAKPDPDYPYLIPVKDGLSVRTIAVNNIKTIFSKGTPANWYCIAFHTNDGDTICASRGGIVVESQDSEAGKDVSFNRNDNFIDILHNDGTLARYTGFEINQVFPKIGERVVASQPLGIVVPGKSNKVAGIRLTVYHAAIDVKEATCVLTKFCTSGIKPEILLPNNNYTAHHFPEVVTIGMSRKMKKKYITE